MNNDINTRVLNVTRLILDDYRKGRDIDNMNVFNQPDSAVVVDLVYKLLKILFPGYYREKAFRSYR